MDGERSPCSHLCGCCKSHACSEAGQPCLSMQEGAARNTGLLPGIPHFNLQKLMKRSYHQNSTEEVGGEYLQNISASFPTRLHKESMDVIGYSAERERMNRVARVSGRSVSEINKVKPFLTARSITYPTYILIFFEKKKKMQERLVYICPFLLFEDTGKAQASSDWMIILQCI